MKRVGIEDIVIGTMLTVLVVGILYAVVAMTRYAGACEDAGGIMVREGFGASNCRTTDGGYIDVGR